MQIRLQVILLLSFLLVGFFGCKNRELANDITPIAESMCRFIEVQNSLKIAMEANDSVAIHNFVTERNKIQVEMTILNQEFKDKYGEKVSDPEFGKKFKREMNKALLECPHISDIDREKMKTEIKEN